MEIAVLFKCELLDPMRFYQNERLFNSGFLRSFYFGVSIFNTGLFD